ncbi:MAG: LAGLIDADG family homing endonuclease [Nanoarchaeota archaeon]
MLIYDNDPLLNRKIMFFKDGTLNLFSALVRRKDFVKPDLRKSIYVYGEELTSFVLKLLPKDNKNLNKILSKYLNHKSKRQFYNIKNQLNSWIDRKLFPLPFLRCLAYYKDSSNLVNTLICKGEYFCDHLGKGKIKLPKTTKELKDSFYFYLAGCSLGDGCIDKSGKQWIFCDGGGKDELVYSKRFIVKIKDYISKKFSLKISDSSVQFKRNCYILQIKNKSFCRFYNFFFGLPFGKKKHFKFPSLIIKLDDKQKIMERSFWRGLFDTDGSIDKKGLRITFSSNLNCVIDICKERLNLIKINCVVNKKGLQKSGFGTHNCNCLYIPYDQFYHFSTKIGFAHPRKQKILVGKLKKGPKNSIFCGLRKNNEKIDEEILHIGKFVRPYFYKENSILLFNRISNGSKLDDFEYEKLKNSFENIFDKKVKGTKFCRVSNKKICTFFDSNFIYQLPWEPLNNNETEIYLKEWNSVFN